MSKHKIEKEFVSMNSSHFKDDLISSGALSKTVAHFSKPKGPNLLERTETFGRWYSNRMDHEVYQYARTLSGAPSPIIEIKDLSGNHSKGINFASQDYLSLSTH